MLAFESQQPIKQIERASEQDLTPALLSADAPVVLRGLVADWPAVKAAQQSSQSAADYLTQWANANPVQAFKAASDVQGRFFYNDNLDGFNFAPTTSHFRQVIDDILALNQTNDPASLYLGSTSINHVLPGFRDENDISVLADAPLVSIWAGNQSRIAAHFDVPDNLACCIAGKRRFTLFPPNQWQNLYVGPLDYTPAGQPASLVDFHQPDFARFPKFRQAIEQCRVVELNPGDAIFIPSMWWHHVEGLTPFNVLINYWWRQVPDFVGAPLDALEHAILSIRALPDAQRQHWQTVFEQYVFGHTDLSHIPESKLGMLNPLDETSARKLRATLLKKLNR